MAASPKWKVYDSRSIYQAACKELEGAAALMTLYGEGSTIRNGHTLKNIIWHEGIDGIAADSYDEVVITAIDKRKK